MKVKELIKMLESLPDDMLIVLQKDAGYSPVHEAHVMTYSPDWSEVHIAELTPELISDGFMEYDLYLGDDGVPALVLWPEQINLDKII